MRLEKARTRKSGVVLIVVVGVLALLSVIAATFGIMMSGELAASRNQTDYETARQAALAAEQYLLNTLQALGAGASLGTLPDFSPDPADPFGNRLLCKSAGGKVYMYLQTPTTGAAPDWTLNLGPTGAGTINLNGHGFLGDLGSNCNPDIRYTSSDTSLVRLLASRFAALSAADMTTLQGYYPTFNTAAEQQRIAILLNQWIIGWRHGPDGVPGVAGAEERRLGHLPRWNSKLGDTNVVAGVGYPSDSNDKFEWGCNDALPVPPWLAPQYALPSRFINTLLGPVGGASPWSYAEPRVWTSYLGGLNWGNDTGLPAPGLFWGKVGSGSTATTIVAETSRPGWRDWPVASWNNYYVFFATGQDKWYVNQIQTNGAAALTLFNPQPFPFVTLPYDPIAGDTFCIFAVSSAPGAFVGLLNRRWSGTDLNAEGDLVPNAMYLPDGTLATEGNVVDLVLDSGTVTSPFPAAGTDAFLYDSTKNWTAAALANAVVHIYAGTGRGQVRPIYDNTNTQLKLGYNSSSLTPWTTALDLTSQYRIELPDNNLPSKYQPNNLQGDDRVYLSLGDLRDSVVVPALQSDGLTLANAQAAADILLPYFQKYLSVSNQGIQASQTLAGINDWATDNVDNTGSGVVDSAAEAQAATLQPNQHRPAAYLQSMYQKLGLKDWASGDATRIQQAAQLLANIIDFADAGDIPTSVSNTDIGEAAVGAFTVYGAKGLHVTQVMPSPDAITSANADGAEMKDDGSTNPNLGDNLDWDWRADHWEVINITTPGPNPPGTPRASFTFSGLQPGYYAVRLIGSNDAFTITYPASTTNTYIVSPGVLGPEVGWNTGFVRNPNASLHCFQVAADGTLTFQLQAPVGAKFFGFALCAQYIQITNIAAHDILLNGLTVATDQSAARGSITLPASYTRPADGKVIDLRRIAGASTPNYGFDSGGNPTTCVFPIRYGTYVMCMCEEAYEKQWTPDPAPVPGPPDPDATALNHNGFWGDERNEAYPVYPFGDLNPDAATMALLIGAKGAAGARTPSVTVTNAAGNLIAGGAVDGAIPPVVNAADCYSSIEKKVILQPTWDTGTTYWAVFQSAPTALSAAQNALVTVQPDPPRVPMAGGATYIKFRSSLNRNYTALWDAAADPTFHTLLKAKDLVTDPSTNTPKNLVLPIILNRPYPTTGWLGLVPTSNAAWRTVDPNPQPWMSGSGQPDTRDAPEKLLGTLMANATVGGIYARFNINTAPVDVLKCVFPDADAQLIADTLSGRLSQRHKGLPPAYAPSLPPCLSEKSWANWDEMLIDPTFQNARCAAIPGIGFYDAPETSGVSNADAGAGTYADGFPDSSNEKKEWFMRFSNLFDLQSTNFRFVVAGMVYKDQPWDYTNVANNAPVAQVRIEVDVDMSTRPPSIVYFRYLGQ